MHQLRLVPAELCEFQMKKTAIGQIAFNEDGHEPMRREGFVKPRSREAAEPVKLLSGGNPQIAKADGDAPVVAFALGAPSPNPSRGTARVPFALPSRARTQLAIFGVDGRCVRTLVDGAMEPGRHDVVWDGRDSRGLGVDAGIYFVRLVSGGQSLSRKLVVISSRRS